MLHDPPPHPGPHRPFDQRRTGLTDYLDAAYPDLASDMANIRRLAHLIDGYAERLFVDDLGADGVDQVLARMDAYADATGRGFLHWDATRLRRDLLVPFAGAFARAADQPDLVAMARDTVPGGRRRGIPPVRAAR